MTIREGRIEKGDNREGKEKRVTMGKRRRKKAVQEGGKEERRGRLREGGKKGTRLRGRREGIIHTLSGRREGGNGLEGKIGRLRGRREGVN